MSDTFFSLTGIGSCGSALSTRRAWKRAVVSATVVVAVAGCSDSVVPYFDSPTSIPSSTTGVQNAVMGLFGATRSDQFNYLWETTGFARDLLWFLGASPNTFTDVAGLVPGANANTTLICCDVWNAEYENAKQANIIVGSLSKVSAYSTAQVQAITGVVQTVKALNFMYLAETRDTLGIPLYAIDQNPTDPPYCNKDVWAYIVSLLDSGFNNLNSAGPIPLPLTVPPGFASVGQTASPSTAAGSFAAFNRALAGKAGLEYAYAIARNTAAGAPTPSSPGSPDAAALLRADSALTASALYNLAAIAPPAAGNFALDPNGVYHTFSGQSGDQSSPINQYYFNFVTLFDFTVDVDTLNDLRWKNKFVKDPQPVQLASYAGIADPHLYLPYASVSSPVPIVRAEGLALVRAQVQIGLGNYATAIALINQVHQQAGGFATPLPIAATYTAVRDTLLKEQRISLVFEGSGDRVIALRMYGLAATADTTWEATSGPDAATAAAVKAVDYHTTIATLPPVELSSRGGAWNLQCP
jgi:starch-binding outer membrane protein, SusD/RagB family